GSDKNSGTGSSCERSARAARARTNDAVCGCDAVRLKSNALASFDGRYAVVSMVMLPITNGTQGHSRLQSSCFCPESSLSTGTDKSPFESAQKATTICANWEIFGFDWGEAEECTAILPRMV